MVNGIIVFQFLVLKLGLKNCDPLYVGFGVLTQIEPTMNYLFQLGEQDDYPFFQVGKQDDNVI